jgi:phosphate transport system substrate-binding protein
VTAFTDALAKDVRSPVVDPPASAKGAYPISGITYVFIPRDDSLVGFRQTFKDFIQYGITKGQDSAEELSYAKLSGPLQQESQGILNQMTDKRNPLK